MTYEVRAWVKKREREWVASHWLREESAHPAYRFITQRIRDWWLFRAVDAVLGHRHTAVLVATPSGRLAEPVGYLVAQQNGNGLVTLFHMYVEPKHRRQGVGRALLQLAVPDGEARPVAYTHTTPGGMAVAKEALGQRAILLYNPFVFLGLVDHQKTGSATEVRFRRRMTKAMRTRGVTRLGGRNA